MRGFESYTILKNNIRDSKQIYDITFHLYQTEELRLKPELEEIGNRNVSIKTSVGAIEHSHKALHDRLITLYPFKLRQLILINTITALEVFLTDIILEIFKRDMKPFKQNEPITFQRNYLLSLSSIDNLKEEIISKDFRNLTSGGLAQIVKYYAKNFDIDIKNIGINFNEIEEIHTRRHLFVHRNGVIDNEYVNKYPEYGFRVSQQLKLDHEYLLYALEKISQFATLINKQLLLKFPEINRKPIYHNGNKEFSKELKNIMLDISVLSESYDVVDYFNNLETPYRKFSDYIVKIVTYDNSCMLFITGTQGEISSFYKHINENKFLKLNKTILI
ncbi:MAG: hypothetical protein ACOVOQ_14555 [Flavobacterium sp.]